MGVTHILHVSDTDDDQLILFDDGNEDFFFEHLNYTNDFEFDLALHDWLRR